MTRRLVKPAVDLVDRITGRIIRIIVFDLPSAEERLRIAKAQGVNMRDAARQELARTVLGRVIEPAEEGYDEARRIWNARFDRRPDVVVQCKTSEDVRVAVDFARKQRVMVSVKSGGHAYAANTVGDGGVLIDLSLMKGIEIDAEKQTARVQPGVRWGELYAATQASGLAPVGGTVSSVGVAGFTLGGGSGDLTRQHGMGCDNLLAAEVITAEAEIVRVSSKENPDLFWALRGGGGNFGVVTSFELRLHDIGPEVLSGQAVHRFAHARDVLRFYRTFMLRAPECMQCYAFLMRVPPIPEFPAEFHGQLALDLVVFSSDPTGESALRPLLDFGEPILSFLEHKSFTQSQQAFDAAMPAGNRWESRSHYLTSLSDDAIDAFIAAVDDMPGMFSCAYFATETGAASRADPSSTAFPHRDAPFSVHVLGGWTDAAEDEKVSAWVRDLHQAMTPYSTGGVYVNLLGTDEQNRVPAAYGTNFARLRAIKTKWDPDNLFRMNHNIDPAA